MSVTDKKIQHCYFFHLDEKKAAERRKKVLHACLHQQKKLDHQVLEMMSKRKKKQARFISATSINLLSCYREL
jgi:hypothetical protein